MPNHVASALTPPRVRFPTPCHRKLMPCSVTRLCTGGSAGDHGGDCPPRCCGTPPAAFPPPFLPSLLPISPSPHPLHPSRRMATVRLSSCFSMPGRIWRQATLSARAAQSEIPDPSARAGPTGPTLAGVGRRRQHRAALRSRVCAAGGGSPAHRAGTPPPDGFPAQTLPSEPVVLSECPLNPAPSDCLMRSPRGRCGTCKTWMGRPRGSLCRSTECGRRSRTCRS